MKAFTRASKTIAVVGGSFGGQNVIANLLKLDPTLSKINVVWVDKLGHFEHIAANYESFVDSKEFAKNSISYDELVKSYEQPNLSFVQGSLSKVLPQDNKILLALKDGSAKEVSYDSLVITTGQYKDGPWRPEDDATPSQQERQAEWTSWADKVKSAKSILCVGGGITGVELSALLKEEFPDKKVTLVHNGEKVLAHAKELHDMTLPMLEGLGVEVVLNTMFSADSELGKKHDLILNCLPGQTLGPKKYMQGTLAEAVEPTTGQIMVNRKFQATNVHPIASAKPETERVWTNVFGFGDCALTPLNEGKAISSILQLAPTLAHNAFSVATGENNFQEMNETCLLQMVPIGKKNGYFMFNGLRVPSPDAYDKKVGLRDNLFGVIRKDPAAFEEKQKSEAAFGGMFAQAYGEDTSNPMHISNVMAEKAEALAAAKARFDSLVR